MNFLRHMLRLCVVMLFSAFGTNTALAVSMTASEITYFQIQTTHFAQGADVVFAARAPPMAAANVGVSGGVTSMQGSAFALYGQEMVAALFGFDRSSIGANRGAGYPNLARPTSTTPANTILGDLDDLGRPTGVTATINQSTIGTGSSANPTIRPPGFEGGANNHSRGHLLANILGGTGNDSRNLVTLFQRHANSPNMRHFEALVRNAVDSGQTVSIRAIPVYSGNNPVPTGITMTARGSGGFNLDVSVRNVNGLAE